VAHLLFDVFVLFLDLRLIYIHSQGAVKDFNECYDDFNRTELLGEGGFASVFRAQHRRNKSYYAVKEVIQSEYDDSTSELKHEIESMKKLRDISYTARLHDVFVTSDRTFLVMEEICGGDLLDRLTEKVTYTETEARIVIRTLLDAVRCCHKKGIAHRDIKPENILLVYPREHDDCTTIKLCDFGCSKPITGPECFTTMAGSPQYAAPEVYDYTSNDKVGYNEQCDLWSVGVVLYILLGGYSPFDENLKSHEMAQMICAGDYTFHDRFWSQISDPPKDLIRHLLDVDPSQRYTSDMALNSPYLRRQEMNQRAQRSMSLLAVPSKLLVSPSKDMFSKSLANFEFVGDFESDSDTEADNDEMNVPMIPPSTSRPIEPTLTSSPTDSRVEMSKGRSVLRRCQSDELDRMVWQRSPVSKVKPVVKDPVLSPRVERTTALPMAWLPVTPVVQHVHRERRGRHERRKTAHSKGRISVARTTSSFSTDSNTSGPHRVSFEGLAKDNESNGIILTGTIQRPERRKHEMDGSDTSRTQSETEFHASPDIDVVLLRNEPYHHSTDDSNDALPDVPKL
jgi:calcium/calmodulin-dependent protein kinase I